MRPIVGNIAWAIGRIAAELPRPRLRQPDTCDCADCRNPAGLLQCEVCGRWRDPDDMADYDDRGVEIGGPLTYCLTDRENCR